MTGRSWNYYFGLAAGVHAFLLLLLALAGVQWMQGEHNEKPAIEVGFVAESSLQAMAGGSEAGGGTSQSVGPTIKTASVAAVEMLQNLRGHSGKSSSMAQPADNVATETAIEQVAAALEASGASGNVSGLSTVANGSGGGSAGTVPGNGNGSGSGGAGTGKSTGLGAGFSPNGDGTYTASSSAGIIYQLLRDADAEYPDEARSIGYGETVEVVARIIVGLDGSVESVTILSDPPRLGFREAASEALYAMRFAPIYYDGVNIRVPFEKHLIFQP